MVNTSICHTIWRHIQKPAIFMATNTETSIRVRYGSSLHVSPNLLLELENGKGRRLV